MWPLRSSTYRGRKGTEGQVGEMSGAWSVSSSAPKPFWPQPKPCAEERHHSDALELGKPKRRAVFGDAKRFCTHILNPSSSKRCPRKSTRGRSQAQRSCQEAQKPEGLGCPWGGEREAPTEPGCWAFLPRGPRELHPTLKAPREEKLRGPRRICPVCCWPLS